MEEIKTKVCSNPNCEHGGEPQSITNFYKNRRICKDCVNKKRREDYTQNRTKIINQSMQYYYANINNVKKKKHERYLNNKDEILTKSKENYQENREEKIEKQKEYYKNHKKEVASYKQKYNNSSAKFDLFYEKLKAYNKCRRDPNNPDLLQVKCHRSECPEWFNPTTLQVLNRLRALNADISSRTHGESNLYCSDKCKELCPVYNQKARLKTKKPKKNYDREVQPELRAMVLERDNYTCQREGCNKSQKDNPQLILHCHHVKPINEDPICSADIDNCITLCAECHKWIHQNVPGCSNAELRCSK